MSDAPKELKELIDKLATLRDQSVDHGLRCAVVYLLEKYVPNGELVLDVKKWQELIGEDDAILSVNVDRQKAALTLRVVRRDSAEYEAARESTDHEHVTPFVVPMPQGDRIN